MVDINKTGRTLGPKAGGGDAILAGKLTVLLILPEFNGLGCIRPNVFPARRLCVAP